MDIPRSMDTLRTWGSTWGPMEALRRRGWQLAFAVLAAFVVWDLVMEYVRGDEGERERDFFYQLFFWLFIGIAGLLVWSTLKALRTWWWRLAFALVVALAVILAQRGAATEFSSIYQLLPGAGEESVHITGLHIHPASLDNWMDARVAWMVEHWRSYFQDFKGGLLNVLVPLEQRLLQMPWWLFIGIVALLAWRVSGYRVALISVAGLLFLGVFDLWDNTMRTTVVVGTATVLSVAVAIPVGIAMAKSDLLQGMMRPVLDTMQVMPSFVYLIPAIYFLGLGKVPATMAIMIYAIPPAMRLTNLGIRLVPSELIEAARAFGTTRWQMLLKVELPLARPTIMAGVNQTVMMALAMVVIAALVGAKGLGSDVYAGIAQLQFGRGLLGGLGIVVMAIIIDRIAQGLARDPRAQSSA